MDILTRAEAKDPELTRDRVLQHIAAVRHGLSYSWQTPIELVVERNGAGSSLAVFLSNDIRRKMAATRGAAQDAIGAGTILMYKEKSKKGETEVGLLTTNPTKAYGVHRIRRRLEERLLRLPSQPIICTRNEMTDAAMRQRFLGEHADFSIHMPSATSRSQTITYSGKKQDDVVMVTLDVDVAVCHDASDEEREICRDFGASMAVG